MYKKNIATWNKKKQTFSCEKTDTVVRAVKKIKLTIYFVYENLLVEKEIKKIRKKFHIPEDFYTDFNLDFESNYIVELLIHTMMKWQKVLRTGGRKIKNKNFKRQIYGSKNLNSLNPQYINDRIWSFIIFAKIFEIPEKILLKTISSLLNCQFPKINDKFQIQIYPTTTEAEFKFIWDDIIEKQKKIIPNIETRPKFEYKTHDLDKKTYKLNQTTDKTHKEIAKKINELGIIPKDKSYTYIEVGKSLRRYKKFIGCSNS
ncbi:hypothetical protein KAI65_04165 [Candidatus Parcubacteria bacterium]|nr:hypothetical protein [Candidatus Parcubacteria bacterium]